MRNELVLSEILEVFMLDMLIERLIVVDPGLHVGRVLRVDAYSILLRIFYIGIISRDDLRR